ncbi:helix-turn-helix domain-containing protein [Shewanella sp. KX20019]|uniref:helix-turn-helix domain-containing protein n=1 Tax=Shewanella sp. KX20019 TaxID=2803864 RepID=UPI003FA79AA6
MTWDTIQQYTQLHFNANYHQNSIYKLLSQLRFSWITSRSKHPKQSLEAQVAFKKVPTRNATSPQVA